MNLLLWVWAVSGESGAPSAMAKGGTRMPGTPGSAWAQAASSLRSLKGSLALTLAGRKKHLWLLGCEKPFEWHQRRSRKMSKLMQSWRYFTILLLQTQTAFKAACDMQSNGSLPALIWLNSLLFLVFSLQKNKKANKNRIKWIWGTIFL